MKIAFLMYNFVPNMGGVQVFAYNLINHLADKDHLIHLYLPYKRYISFAKYINVTNIKVIPIFRYEFFISRYLPGLISKRLMNAQKKYHYDVWQIVGAYPAGWVAKELSAIVPTILRTHGDDIQKDEELQYGLGLNPIFEKKIKITLNKMNHLIALTDTVKQCYTDYGISISKISIIPNGIKTSLFNIESNKNYIRNKYGIKDGQIFILSVGRYHIKKGYEYIPCAIKYLRNLNYDIKWLIIGKGMDKIKPLIIENDVSQQIIFEEEITFTNLPKDNEVPSFPDRSLVSIYKSADLFVMPSIIETFGMVLIEAMAAGLPIITTNAPGCRDVVSNNYNGILVAPKNPEALAKGILRVIENPGLKDSLIKNGKNSIIKYDWGNITQEYEHLYYHIVGKKRLRSKN